MYNRNTRYELVRENNNDDGYYNQKSKYDFDSIEEYDRKEGHPEVQRDQYTP